MPPLKPILVCGERSDNRKAGKEKAVRVSIFLSHSSVDKLFARRLARDLDNQGVTYWLDEGEIKIGDYLIEKLRSAIDDVEYLAVILSPDAVASAWVQREVEMAISQEILGRRIKILPIMYRRCELPDFLLERVHGDFTDDSRYAASFEKLMSSVGVVFNRNAFLGKMGGTHLGVAADKAWSRSIPILAKPFHRPFQYIGMTIQEAAREVGASPNDVGNIVLESDDCHLLLEAEGNFVQYVDLTLKFTGAHTQIQGFDSEAILGAVSISPAELELVRRAPHYHTYYDHAKRMKIGVSCQYDGAPLSIGFSRKYYGM
jgi:hypothetical protein